MQSWLILILILVIVGVLWFRESVAFLKVASVLLIALGVADFHLNSIAGAH